MRGPISRHAILFGVLVAIGAGLSPARLAQGRHHPKRVPWTEVRAAIESVICSRSTEVNGQTFYYVVYGTREGCGLEGPPSKLDRVVAAAFRDAGPLIGSLGFRPALFDSLKALPAGDRDPAARKAFLDDQRFLKALVPRIEAGMKEIGQVCEACPVFPITTPRTLPYAVLRPYLEAHVWPDEVTDNLDAEGRPTGARHYSFHICAGLNGVSRLEDPDPDLVRAAFVVVFGTPAIHQRASEVFRAHASRPELAALATDRERTEILRREVPVEVFSGGTLLPVICGSLERFGDDLGLRIDECPSSASESD